MRFQKILKEMVLTEGEHELIERSDDHYPGLINVSRNLTSIYQVKKFETIAQNIITSNERLASANEKYASGLVKWTKALVWVTGGLVLVSIIQLLIIIFK